VNITLKSTIYSSILVQHMTVSMSNTTNCYETFWNSWQPGKNGECNNGKWPVSGKEARWLVISLKSHEWVQQGNSL